MRKKVEYYSGRKITKDVLRRINLIDLKRIQEGINKFSMEEINSLKELCDSHETRPKNEHIILGEDWYIIYTDLSDMEIEIKDWVAINSVDNKFTQTMEMFNALKQILLKHKDHDIYSTLRHSTSYPFYKKFLDQGYFEESYDILDFDDENPKLEEIKEKILSEYDSLYDYLEDENRNKYEDASVDDFIYHDVVFNVTDVFTNKYKK